jgi:hypothetical protein
MDSRRIPQPRTSASRGNARDLRWPPDHGRRSPSSRRG